MNKLLPCIVMSIILSILTSCSFQQKKTFRRKLYFVDQSIQQNTPSKASDSLITIWIHGARPFAPNTYNLGLKSPSQFDPNDHVAQSAYALICADPIAFPLDHFYIYSWSGILNFSERQHASTILYTEIIRLIDNYRKTHNKTPKIRIIAHSHGGNVVLNLALNTKCNFVIDELILLAVPVQAKTQDLVHSPLFKQVFSLYSTIDIPQIIDPQLFYRESGTYLLFSGQRFAPGKNLMQIKVKINGQACQHLQFNNISTLTIMPQIIEQLHQWVNELPPDVLTFDNTRFMLSIYTNGRHKPTLKCYHSRNFNEHIELPMRNNSYKPQ